MITISRESRSCCQMLAMYISKPLGVIETHFEALCMSPKDIQCSFVEMFSFVNECKVQAVVGMMYAT